MKTLLIELDTEDERVEIVSVGLLRSMRIYCPRYQDSGEVTAYNPGEKLINKIFRIKFMRMALLCLKPITNTAPNFYLKWTELFQT